VGTILSLIDDSSSSANVLWNYNIGGVADTDQKTLSNTFMIGTTSQMIAVATSSNGNSVFSKIIFPNTGPNSFTNMYATINLMVHGCFAKDAETLVILYGDTATA
jgi:hypothetical protein